MAIYGTDNRSLEPKIIAVYLHTHSCTANHSKRAKYRSAIYFFNDKQSIESSDALATQKKLKPNPIDYTSNHLITSQINRNTIKAMVPKNGARIYQALSLIGMRSSFLSSFSSILKDINLVDIKKSIEQHRQSA